MHRDAKCPSDAETRGGRCNETLFSVLQTAKEQGAKIVRDVYEESDDFGTVRLATVQTVSPQNGLELPVPKSDLIGFLRGS